MLGAPSMRVLATVLFALASCSSPEPARVERAPRAQPTVAATHRTPEEVRREGNHLLPEPSPYLQQHAHNPVDWYPWGPEAFARARRENKPIFLSIGYSTCHWCHVMEQESFEDDEVADYLNRHFIAIKVDREQRPDVDALYLDAVAALGASTGWPLTVFLTPELAPFHGGTYFPRHGGRGRPGFLDVLEEVKRRFDETGPEVAARGRAIFEAIERDARSRGATATAAPGEAVARAMIALERMRDREHGGFGGRQKFPNAPLLLAELRYVARTRDPSVEAHLVTTLEHAMRGGVLDHLTGTFHRYAVDRAWHVPHFEKTLYDNAQLALVYVEAGLALGRDDFVEVGRAALDELVATWQLPDGGLVVGFDADDPGGEGFYYSWTRAELERALGPGDARAFATLFDVGPHDAPLEGARSVLHRLAPQVASTRLGLDAPAIDALVARALPRLRAARAARAAPAVDDKQLASWNGLAILALATAGRWLEEPRYVEAAQRAARFVLERLWQPDRATMLRGARHGVSLGDGFLDDHALPALALLRLHAADGDERWLLAADALGRAVVERFYDAERRAFMCCAEGAAGPAPLRRPDVDDGVLPAGGNAAIALMLELGALEGDRALLELGLDAADAATARAMASPFGSGFLLTVLDQRAAPRREVVIAGGADESAALFAVVRPSISPRLLVARVPAGGAGAALAERFPALRGKVAIGDRPTAFVCEVGRCELPTSEPATLRRQLAALE